MDVRENMGVLGITTVVAKGVGCQSQKLALADKWTPGVSLQKETEESRLKMWNNTTSNRNNKKKTFFDICIFLFEANHFHLANSSCLVVKRCAEHVLTVVVLLPPVLALKVELQLLSGLLEDIRRMLVGSSFAPANNQAVDKSRNFEIFLRQPKESYEFRVQFGFLL